ncbi:MULTISPECIES: aldehyde dehydrogenase family protein [unclassified Saccharopolyspora]|uniref:aldehyde dehydrogenase family protein n=1 Tax=unclassified Saccharopolyspora TaxID=2646250 RepID=UPI001CD7C60A|nr:MULTISPECIES: aldehyde dehydrogenase family protein [unclassified Saccharopolyspora]MCA1188262.1 aldehyde dehydrogenase family protein [Saccharopolyspora sp. 6T]MCA1194046.1 aldehyde dehydrogenase family protein [Saccharopolyspora sp. 6V]MCA1281521.1 aldehyde dehydrogenase family protein [Saccharopolyspora sp. 7B]
MSNTEGPNTLFIDGTWQPAAAGGVREIRSPADGTLVTTVSEGDRGDTERAVRAARRAFDDGTWPDTSAWERGDLLLRVADILVRDKDEFARAESGDTGKRLVESEYDMDDIAACFRYFGKIAGTDGGSVIDTGSPDSFSRVRYEPVGVCGMITPWNYPLLQVAWKVAPAIAAGDTFVLKPSELTPSTAVLLMRALTEAGLPAGVGNLVLGTGAEVGSVLSEHPDIDLVSFTGGLHTGRKVAAAAAATVKKVALELGGKNPNVVFADADFDTAVDYALMAVFLHSGQVCSAGARLIVQDEIHDRFVDEVVRRAERIRLGGPFDADAETGPLISAAHLEKVSAYVAKAVEEGAVLRTGGRRPEGEQYRDGHYYLPTVLDEVRQGSYAVVEESFGPVLTVERFTDEDDAVRIANDTHYGLAGAVFSSDVSKAQRVAHRLRHGTVWINDFHPYLPQAEWGGFKQSGVGRELGRAGLGEYQEAKHIHQNLRPTPPRWFDGR